MFLETLHKLRHTLALRLTLWYAGIFSLSSMLAFALVFALMATIVQQRTDQELLEDIEEYAAFMRIGGLDRVKSELVRDAQGADAQRVFFRLWTAGGRELMTTDLSAWSGLGDPREILARFDDVTEPILETRSLPRQEREVRIVYGAIAPGIILESGEPIDDNEELLAALLNGILIAIAAVLMLGGPIGWFMARRALRGVQEVTRTAKEIASGALERRVALRSQGDEIDVLAQTFNTMLDRIQALIVGMRQMSDNLAHDIRSPLARIRAAAETALANAGSKADFEMMMATTVEECDRLLEMVNTTLDIAEAESGAARLRFSAVDMVRLVRDALELFTPIAEDKQIALTFATAQQCLIDGDRQRLQRVIANLLDNALKYTAPGGQVNVQLTDDGRQVSLSIVDTGIGISAADSSRIFERFYRCDQSRSQRGNGLGLSLALAFVRAHGGALTVQSTPGQGSVFTAVFFRKPSALPRAEARFAERSARGNFAAN